MGANARTPETFRKLVLVHLALITTQTLFGGGSIIGKFGVKGSNPVLFALIREGCAGPLLMLAAWYMHREKFDWRVTKDTRMLLLCGFALYANQLCYIVGLKLSDSITASIWQPSQPVFTAIIAILLGWEKASWRKLLGIAVASAGAVFVVLYGVHTGESGVAVGSLFFAINCLGTSTYVLASKPLLRTYEAISVTGWSYMCCSVMMLFTAFVFNGVDALTRFICHDADAAVIDTCVASKWHVNPVMIGPLAYWILFNSCAAYGLMTWANVYADGSVVSAYTAIQPMTAALLSFVIIAAKGEAYGKKYGFAEPGVNDLGALGIFVGLGLVLSDKAARRRGDLLVEEGGAADGVDGGGGGVGVGSPAGIGMGGPFADDLDDYGALDEGAVRLLVDKHE